MPAGAAEEAVLEGATLRLTLPLRQLEPLPPLPPAPAPQSVTGIHVENWIGILPSAPPERITAALEAPTTLVLADRVEFDGQKYSRGSGTAPPNIVLIADTIQVKTRFVLGRWGGTEAIAGVFSRDDALFNLDGALGIRGVPAQSGGDVIVLARRLECDTPDLGLATSVNGGSDLNLVGGGVEGPGGHSGNVIIAAEQLVPPLRDILSEYENNSLQKMRELLGQDRSRFDSLRALAQYPWWMAEFATEIGNPDREKFRQKQLEIYELLVGEPTRIIDDGLLTELANYIHEGLQAWAKNSPFTVCAPTSTSGGHYGNPPGRDGKPHLLNGGRLADAIALDRDRISLAISSWVLAMLDRAHFDIRNAVLLGDRAEVVRRFIKINELLSSENYPIIPEHLERHRQVTDALIAAKEQNMLALWTHPVTVQVPGAVPRSLDAMVEASDLLTRLAPTEALVRERVVDGNPVLGLLAFDTQRPDQITLDLDVELTVDPWLGALASEELATTDERYAGAFADWDLRFRPIAELGVKASDIDQAPPGANRLQVTLTLDAEAAGLAVWRLASSGGLPLTADWEYRTDRQVKGELAGPALSLARRSETDLVLAADGQVMNGGPTAVTLEYARLGDGRFHPFRPALTILPNATVTLPLPADADPAAVTLPPEAVVHSVDPAEFAEHFAIINGEHFVEQITVTNLLGHDPERGGALQYVEITVAYGGEGGEVVSGPYRLASRGAQGSERTVRFLKVGAGGRHVRVSGTAVYEHGSSQELTPRTTSDLTFKITADMLPPIS